MKISGLCLLISFFVLSIAAYASFGAAMHWRQETVSMLVLIAIAVSCLGTLELRIHRRLRSEQQRKASALASALRNGALR